MVWMWESLQFSLYLGLTLLGPRLVTTTLTQIVWNSSWKWCWARRKKCWGKKSDSFMISLYFYFTFSSCCSTFTPSATLLSERLEQFILLPKILVKMVSSRLREVCYRRGLPARWDKNETDFKRKGGLQAVKVSSHNDSLVLVTLGREIAQSHFLASIISIIPTRTICKMQGRFLQDGIQAQTVRKQCWCEFKSFTKPRVWKF